MSQRVLPPGTYGFDDLALSDRIDTASVKLTLTLIDGFAALTGDQFEIHMSDEAAGRHGFAGRVAHGLLVLALIDGLKNQTPAQFRAIASLGWDWQFRAPVLAGDTIRAVMLVEDKREVTRADRGILGIGFEVFNQRDEVVQRGRNQLMVYR
jgi:3-hydroxybutyryl-CoA dehydratase